MKLHERVLGSLSEMVVGDHPLFPYRSSSYITEYFQRCGLQVAHDGTTRKWWAKDRLIELNLGPASAPDLPSDDLLNIVAELFDPLDFEKKSLAIEPALEALNTVLKRHSLVAIWTRRDAVMSETQEAAPHPPPANRNDHCRRMRSSSEKRSPRFSIRRRRTS